MNRDFAGSRPKILICDDDIEFSTEMTEALTRAAFQRWRFLTVSAVRRRTLSPTIILLDMCMPGRDGIDILKLLSQHERKSHFKVVLISGWEAPVLATAAKLCESWGIELLGVFRKPVALQPLCELLEGPYPGDVGNLTHSE